MKDTLGGRIRERRKGIGETQAGLAKRLGVSESTVRMWELNKNEPDIMTVNMLCGIFGCTPNDLVWDNPTVSGESEVSLDGVRFAFMSETEGLSDEKLDAIRKIVKLMKEQEGE